MCFGVLKQNPYALLYKCRRAQTVMAVLQFELLSVLSHRPDYSSSDSTILITIDEIVDFRTILIIVLIIKTA